MKIKYLFVLTIAIAILSFMVTNSTAQTTRKAGTVRDEDGKPIAGAVIKLLRIDRKGYGLKAKEITDKNGKFTFISLRYGFYLVTVDAKGYVIHQRIIEMKTLTPDITDTSIHPIRIVLIKQTYDNSNEVRDEIINETKRGHDLLETGKFDEAADIFASLASKYPVIEGHMLLYQAMAFHLKGDLQKAKELFIRSTVDEVVRAFAYKFLGDIAIAEKDFLLALRYYDRFLAIKQDEPQHFITAGDIALHVRNMEKAAQFFQAYVKVGEDPELLSYAYMNLGYLNSAFGENVKAVRNLEKALEYADSSEYRNDIITELVRLKAHN